MSQNEEGTEQAPRKKFEWRWNGGIPTTPPPEKITGSEVRVEEENENDVQIGDAEEIQQIRTSAPDQVLQQQQQPPQQMMQQQQEEIQPQLQPQPQPQPQQVPRQHKVVSTARTQQPKTVAAVHQQQPQPPATKQRSERVLVGIPCHNAESSIAGLIVQLRSIASEILICDDGSTDRTGEIARALGCEVIVHPRELGEGDSLRSILLAAGRKSPDALLTIGVDRSDESYVKEELPKLLRSVLKKECDIAVATRASAKEDESEEEEDAKKKSKSKAKPKPKRSIDASAILDSLGNPISNTISFVRAYGKEALSRITPSGANNAVVYDEILNFAMDQNMRIYQVEISTDPQQEEADSSHGKRSKKSSEGGAISRLYDATTVRHPLLVFGLGSILFLAAGAFLGVQTLLIFLSPKTLGDISYSGIMLSAGAVMCSIIFAVTAAILYSIKRNSSRNDGRRA